MAGVKHELQLLMTSVPVIDSSWKSYKGHEASTTWILALFATWQMAGGLSVASCIWIIIMEPRAYQNMKLDCITKMCMLSNGGSKSRCAWHSPVSKICVKKSVGVITLFNSFLSPYVYWHRWPTVQWQAHYCWNPYSRLWIPNATTRVKSTCRSTLPRQCFDFSDIWHLA